VTCTRSRDASLHGERLAALAEHEERRDEAGGRRDGEERRAPRSACEQERGSEAEQELRAEEHLEEGHGRCLQGGEREMPASSGLFEAREREQAAECEAERRDQGIGVDERQQQVAAQQVAPPVGLRVAREGEGEVRQQQRPRQAA
jgi:hypothetical protein